jgi:hypothetical protein
MIDLLERISLDKFEVTFLYSTLQKDPTFLDALPRLQQRGVRLIDLPMKRNISPVADIRSFFTIWLVIQREKPHIVHCHNSKVGYLGRCSVIYRQLIPV